MSSTPNTATAHYDQLLAEHYSWMVGDFATTAYSQRDVLEKLGVSRAMPAAASNALDLGAGPGYQTLALAELGHRVTSVDASVRLLAELEARRGERPIDVVVGDIRDIASLRAVRRTIDERGGYRVVVCMGDTLTHLDSGAEVERLFSDVHAALAPGGVFVLTFRDLTVELTGLDRFIPVRSDPDRVMICFLEYERDTKDTVLVHDLVHVREGSEWILRKSCYRKLRIAPERVVAMLAAAGFAVTHHEPVGRLVGITARKKEDDGAQ